ncbi:MAG: nucleotidyltransferase family protein [Duncaniella sp.]|nr:nucleotidyltransferase family protein [Duncaniella sp.]
MKGLIFAAGLGTRLYPLTAEMPKALVSLAGVPMLQRVIEKFRDCGITEVVINTHHFADKIEAFLRANDNFGIDIKLSREADHPLETGGGLVKASPWLDGDEPVVIHNADIYTDFPLQDMISRHLKSGSDVTLLVDNRKSSRQLLFDGDNMMRGWINLNTGEVKPADADVSRLTQKAFGGVHVINPATFLRRLVADAADEVFSITPYYVSVCRDMKISGYTPTSPYGWHDIGTIEKLRVAENYLLSK